MRVPVDCLWIDLRRRLERRHRFSQLAMAALVPLLLLVPAGFLWAAGIEWITELALEERYDDNVTRLSPSHLDRLDRLGGGTGLPCGSGNTDASGHQFSITTPDDFISIPQLSSSLNAGWIAEMPTGVDLDLSGYQYARNTIKNYQSYRLSVSQPLHRFRAHATSVQFSRRLVPRYYLRNLRSDRASEEFAQMGIFVLPPPRREATYRSESTRFELEQVIVKNRLRFQGEVGVERRNYNRCFDERDSRMPFREAELAWNPRGDKRLRLRASYRREVLRARGDLADTPVFAEPDITNVRSIRAGDVRFGWGRRGRNGWASLRYETERRDFRTGDPNDITHFGRTDRRQESSLSAQINLKRGWHIGAEARRERNRSKFPVTPGGFEPDEVTDYDDTVFQIGFGYRFQSPHQGGRIQNGGADAGPGQDEGLAP